MHIEHAAVHDGWVSVSEYEDKDGRWHAGQEDGRDRPETRVDDTRRSAGPRPPGG